MDDTVIPAGRPAGAVVMDDVARLAGVSQKTVSRVVNGSPQVREAVRERVNAAIDELGYRPNGAARALAAGRTHLIGIVAMGSPLFGIAQHVIGVERAARERGYGTVVVSTSEHESDAEVRPAVERALELGAEGVVVVEPFWRDPDQFEPLADVPLVCALHATTGRPRHASVTSGEEDGGRQAAEHLLSLGHRRIAHISGPTSWRPAMQREAGWRAALQAAGVDAAPALRGDWSARSGYAAAQQLLHHHERVTALFLANDAMAIGAIRAFCEAGLRIPDDVAVVGFDDLPESEFQVVPLTSLRQDFAEISARSVDQLVRAVERQPLPAGTTVVPARLVVRASSLSGPDGSGRPR